MMSKRWCPAAKVTVLGLVIAALLSCSLPPYNPELSMAVKTADQMHLVAKIGPIPGYYSDLESRDIRFIPFRQNLINGVKPSSGFLIAAGKYASYIYGVSGGSLSTYSATLNPDNRNPHKFTMTFSTIKGDTDTLLAFYYTTSGFMASTYKLSSTTVSPVTLAYTPGTPYPLPVGVALYPTVISSYDCAMMLWHTDISNDYEWRQNTTPASGLDTAAGQRIFSPSYLPAGLERCFYGFHEPTVTSYLSYYDKNADRFRTLKWDDRMFDAIKVLPSEIPGLDKRIDTVLSTNRLYCIDDEKSIGYVYSSDGKEITHFPLGNLHLAFEILDNLGNGTLYFTMAAFSKGQGDQEQLTIFIYSLPTKDIGNL